MTFTKEQLKLLLHCVELEYNHVDTDADSAWYIWRVLGLGDREEEILTARDIKRGDAQALSMLKELMDKIKEASW